MKPQSEASIGNIELVLIDSVARRDVNEFTGRTDSNKRVIHPMSLIDVFTQY
jgi:hypothetical protein